MIKSIIVVGLGGFAGSIARYLVGLAVANRIIIYSLPIGTLVVNVIGSLLFGIVVAMLQKYQMQDGFISLLLLTGFCGGFTTFSTFTFENINFLQQGQLTQFIIYTLASFIIALVAIAMGFKIGKLI